MQSDQSLCKLLEYYMNVKLLTEHHLEFLSVKGGCTGLYEFTLVKCHIVGNLMPRLTDFDLTSHAIYPDINFLERNSSLTQLFCLLRT